jgi:hypothetical protein
VTIPTEPSTPASSPEELVSHPKSGGKMLRATFFSLVATNIFAVGVFVRHILRWTYLGIRERFWLATSLGRYANTIRMP